MKFLVYLSGLLLVVGCGSLKTKHDISKMSPLPTTENDEIVQIPVDPDSDELPANDAQSAESVEAEDQDSEEAELISDTVDVNEALVVLKSYPDIPHHFNRHVQKWLNYFQGRGEPHMRKYLERSAKYLPLMKKILKENGLPEDLVYIALIESGFGSSARSHAGAVGYWQFIAPTARRYGLEVNALVDERKDPIKSTQAAVRYFRSLYNVFGNWYFAFAAYNGGENRMFRVLMKHDSRDFWTIAEARMLPKETANYIPKYLAARMIAKNPDRYGFNDIEYTKDRFAFSEVVADKTVNLRDLSKELNSDYETIKGLNPQFNTEYAPIFKGKSLILRIPQDKISLTTDALAKSYVQNPRWLANIKSSDFSTYRVRRGDTLSTIARKHKTTISRIRSLNKNIGRSGRVYIGQRIKVPENFSNIKSIVAKKRVSSRPASSLDTKTYQVRRGDTLYKIAVQHKTTMAQLKNLNRDIGKDGDVYIGQRLKVPDVAGRTIAKSTDDASKQIVVVRRGDTLTNIARRYGVPLSKILSANDLTKKSVLLAGSRIYIPD